MPKEKKPDTLSNTIEQRREFSGRHKGSHVFVNRTPGHLGLYDERRRRSILIVDHRPDEGSLQIFAHNRTRNGNLLHPTIRIGETIRAFFRSLVAAGNTVTIIEEVWVPASRHMPSDNLQAYEKACREGESSTRAARRTPSARMYRKIGFHPTKIQKDEAGDLRVTYTKPTKRKTKK